ncbi:glycosyltransferase [Streptococcus thermophilus]|uniref:glycosyltransferase n=1 Tax=Streptococcus thermophilus TaxID=1308 RepID=UPI003AF00364
MKNLQKFVHKNPVIKLRTFGFKKPENFPEQIEFFENPSRNELNSWYDSIDIFYVPSLYEAWGLPAMEAMARGCTAATTRPASRCCSLPPSCRFRTGCTRLGRP